MSVMLWRAVVVAACVLAPAAARADDTPPSYDAIVRERILPQEEALLVQLVAKGRSLVIDGQPVFNGKDKFLPGKIALGLVDFIVTLPNDDPRLPGYLKDFRQVAQMTVDDADDSWGAYYYVLALDKLKHAGRLDQAVDPLTFAKLRVRLDWRMFVDPDSYDLIDHPNNYYVVAFAIARLRHDMGWEDAHFADDIYKRIVAHYDAYSGFGFADETDGEGRFDRYSVLLAGELANHFLETGGTPPPEALGWLRASADVMLARLHDDGEGFEYGRSLGPYSETAIIEVLTAAARLGVLDDAEKQRAYAYATRAAGRYVDVWIDKATGSVNLWDGGRRTDDYRGKFRVLGENLSLAHQFAYTDEAWNAMGFKGKPPSGPIAVDSGTTVTWFARGDYDRALVTRTDHGHLIGLPLVNGGDGQHMHSPYFPIPFSRGMLEGVADGTAPLLVPQFTLDDGSVLMPLAFIRHVKVTDGAAATVTYDQSGLDRMGGNAPVFDDRLSVATTYRLGNGTITRTDVYTPKAPLKLASIRLDFAGFSAGAVAEGTAVRFGDGAVTGFAVTGLDGCTARALDQDHDYESDTGAMTSLVICTSAARTVAAPFTISWTLSYH